MYPNIFILLYLDNSFKTYKKKKRYVYFVGENVGNFRTNVRDNMFVITHIALAFIITSASKVSYDLYSYSWHSWLTFFNVN